MSRHIEKPAKAGGFSSLQSTFKQVLQSQKTRQNIKNLLRDMADRDRTIEAFGGNTRAARWRLTGQR